MTTTASGFTQPPLPQPHEQELVSLFLQFIRSIRDQQLPDSLSSVCHSPAPRNHAHGAQESTTFIRALQASLNARKHRRPSTLADLRSYTTRILKFSRWEERDIRSISCRECRNLLNTHFGKSAHIFGKARTVLHSIFSHAQRQGWCEHNPVDGIDTRPLYEEKIRALTLKEIRALMEAADTENLRDMDAALRLMLWCGVRPGEMQRLKWRDIDRRENCVYIDSNASKTGGTRAIPLRGAARKLRRMQFPPEERIAPRNWLRQWARLRRRAGLQHWQRDALRHTFASFHLKYFHNLYLLQEEMGHRDSHLLRTRYLNLRNISARGAHVFFNME